MSDLPPGDALLTAEERGAVRAYLQRSEVRLSTIHRVATALLSGAGLMVLLPAVGRDAVVQVLRPLLTGELGATDVLLVVAVAATLAVPFAALWLVLRDLTQFYFHANHIRHEGGETFTPRFTLTGLRLPSDELTPASAAALDAARVAPSAVELLVPANDAARAAIDQQVATYFGHGPSRDTDDGTRAAALFELAASRARALDEEVAKVEHGMARHVLRIQVIVLRYVKALLALLTTALAAFAAAAVADGKTSLTAGDEVWLAAVLLLWAPVAIVAVTSPVRWLERQLRSEGATHTAIGDDRELTRVEDVTVRLAGGGFVAAAAAMGLALARDDLTTAGRAWGGAALAIAAALLVASLVTRTGRGARRAPR